MKKIFVLLLIASIAASSVSCKFIKKKFGKQEEVVADSTSVGEGEFADDGSSSDFSDAELLSDSSMTTTSDAGTDALSSTDTKTAEEAAKPAETTPAPAPAKAEKQVAKAEPKPAATPAKSTATTSAKAKTSANTATAATATTTPTRRRSGSIYDGVNDQEERAIIRRAEGYNDAYYVDDYNGSNSEYERHYKKASELDGSKDYIVPASGYADGRQTGPARGPKKALPSAPAHSQPAAKAANAGNANNASANGQIGTVPTKVDQKPKTANEIIQKK